MEGFDSKQYSFCDLSVAYGGRILEGVTALKYKVKRDKSYLRGRGRDPHRILHGENDYEGSFKIWQSDLESMIQDAPDKDILSLSFNIIATYTPKDGGRTVTDILESAEIVEFEKGLASGDKNMEIELPIMFLKLKLQQ